jgi:hypothetical protein
MKLTTPNIIRLLCLSLFVSSLFFYAFEVKDYDGCVKQEGFALALMGSTAFLVGGILETLVWMANPFFLYSVFYCHLNEKKRRITALAAFLLSSSFFFWKEILVSENGRTAEILYLDKGFYLWWSSIFIFSAYVLYDFFQEKK